ncbi:hypothetical protein [Brachybacterium sp. YJGR34]|uniref:hypothetical protein n=1 Tax=Brachybacterium sp. YJGR34 TaxID=2059911 RepID=UPI000E0A945F|nr:hypothetical protein [Brachybacterium sp. YJGR34]
MSETPYDPELDTDETGPTGPDGVESADRLFELERERDALSRSEDAADFPRDLGEEDMAAAEQGNRDGDEMVSDGEEPDELAELAEREVDAPSIDLLGEGEEDREGEQ